MKLDRLLGIIACSLIAVAASAQGLKLPVEYHKLDNGLRVVISEDHSAPVITVAVYYEIGFRLEPKGRTGFAHLFEHMMFQGSENVGKVEHIKLVNSNGGTLNGSTRFDFTNYFEVLPSNTLELALWLEADRMRSLKVTPENLKNQQEVVKEEVRVNVLNQPYGGFPWLDTPQAANQNWHNAHNFYGDLNDLDAATIGDVQDFFKTYYAPNNAVLTVSGDVNPAETLALVKKHFGSIPAQPPPKRVDVAEPKQTAERRKTIEDPLANLPALAIAFHVPDRRTPDWYAMQMIEMLLNEGRSSRLYRKLVKEKEAAIQTDGGIDYGLGDIFSVNGPTLYITRVLYKPQFKPEDVVGFFDEAVKELQENGVGEEELNTVKVKFRSDYYSEIGNPFGRANYLSLFALFDNNPSLINNALEGFLKVTPAQIGDVARRYLVKENRTVLVRQPKPRAAAAPPPATATEKKGDN